MDDAAALVPAVDRPALRRAPEVPYSIPARNPQASKGAAMSTTRFVVTPDGVRLHVTDSGDGEPVLFLHEYAGDHRSWARQAALRADHRCLTLSARGYPPSDVPADPSSYSWQQA